MAKRVFTFAGLTAIAGTVMASMGGCSSGTTFIFVEGGTTTDAGIDRHAPDKDVDVDPPDTGRDAVVLFDASKDTGVDAKKEAGEAGGPGTCPTTDAIDATTFPWKPPAIIAGACSNAELSAFVAYVDTHADPQTWKAGITNPTCQSCVFATETTTWPPMILNGAGQLAQLNVGGCIAIASGKEACGKGYQQWRDCYLEACADCPDGDSNAFSKCVTAANKTACKKAFEDVVDPSGCGDAQTAGDAETACDGTKYVFEGPIRAQCIGLP